MLYAILDAIYMLKIIILTNCKVLFEIIRLKIKELGNRILARLKAASALYQAIMHNNLLIRDLFIKSNDEYIPFKEVVSYRKQLVLIYFINS